MKDKSKEESRQYGYLYQQSGKWVFRVREVVIHRGVKRLVHRAHTLFPVSTTFPDERSVRESNELRDILKANNRTSKEPRALLTLGEFVENTFLPWIEKNRRPATFRCYRMMWQLYLAARCGDVEMLKVNPADVTGWLQDIADKEKNGNADIAKSSVRRIRALLSSIFTLARSPAIKGGLPESSTNPVRDAFSPMDETIQQIDEFRDELETDQGPRYSLEEINAILSALPEPSRTVTAVAAYAGLRWGELQGLRWKDIHDGAIHMRRSVWNRHVVPLKTKKSRGAIPMIRKLDSILKTWWVRMGEPKDGWVFPSESEHDTPVQLANLVNRQVRPTLEQCGVCGKRASQHSITDHEYQRNDWLPNWRGWHAFRRGLASNLNRLGITDSTIQKILRHADAETTRKHYIEVADADAVAAMEKLDKALETTCLSVVRNVANANHDRVN